jgi:hypothetical protein
MIRNKIFIYKKVFHYHKNHYVINLKIYLYQKEKKLNQVNYKLWLIKGKNKYKMIKV